MVGVVEALDPERQARNAKGHSGSAEWPIALFVVVPDAGVETPAYMNDAEVT